MVQEADLIRLKREAKAKNGFYVEPEAKLVFVVSWWFRELVMCVCEIV